MHNKHCLKNCSKKAEKEMDSLVSGVKKFIKSYGKEKGYAYIYGTGDAASILYAEDKFDITKEIIKALNDKYKTAAKTGRKSTCQKIILY